MFVSLFYVEMRVNPTNAPSVTDTQKKFANGLRLLDCDSSSLLRALGVQANEPRLGGLAHPSLGDQVAHEPPIGYPIGGQWAQAAWGPWDGVGNFERIRLRGLMRTRGFGWFVPRSRASLV